MAKRRRIPLVSIRRHANQSASSNQPAAVHYFWHPLAFASHPPLFLRGGRTEPLSTFSASTALPAPVILLYVPISRSCGSEFSSKRASGLRPAECHDAQQKHGLRPAPFSRQAAKVDTLTTDHCRLLVICFLPLTDMSTFSLATSAHSHRDAGDVLSLISFLLFPVITPIINLPCLIVPAAPSVPLWDSLDPL